MTRSRLRPALATGALALALALVFQVGGAFSSSEGVQQSMKVQEAYNLIIESYVEDVDSAKLAESAIEGMLADLDPHSIYISPEEMRAVRESFNATFDGIGIYYEFVEGEADQDTLVVLMPIAGGPSEEAGLEAGDRIVMIDDTSSVGFDTELVQKYLKGPRGTRVDLVVKRPGFRQPLEFTITRDRIPLETVVSTYMLDDETGYIKLQRFARTSHEEVKQSIRELRAQGMERLVLDLRDNAGGLLDQAYAISDEFLEAGEMIVYTDSRHPRNRRQYVATSGGMFEDDPLIVLVNENSASASEIVAGAVQDHDRGLLVGRQTFGKGLVQQQFPLSDGSVMQMTVSRYYTPTGRLIQTQYEVGESDDDYFSHKRELRDAIAEKIEAGGMMDGDAFASLLPDSLKYQTDGGRTVYGGGGIFPDYVVGIDTLSRTGQIVIGKALDSQFAREFVASHPGIAAEWEGRQRAFARGYELPAGTMEEFLAFAERTGTRVVDERSGEDDADAISRAEFDEARTTIETRIRAFIARRTFGIDAFFPVVGQIDPTLTQATRLWDTASRLASL